MTVDRHAELRNAKGLMTDRNFEGEFTTLLNIATDLARCNGTDVPQDDIRHAARTADCVSGLPHLRHRRRVNRPGCRAVEPRCCQRRRTGTGVKPVGEILTGDDASSRDAASLFRTRFQQLTGPLMAKSVEDTLFSAITSSSP